MSTKNFLKLTVSNAEEEHVLLGKLQGMVVLPGVELEGDRLVCQVPITPVLKSSNAKSTWPCKQLTRERWFFSEGRPFLFRAFGLGGFFCPEGGQPFARNWWLSGNHGFFCFFP